MVLFSTLCQVWLLRQWPFPASRSNVSHAFSIHGHSTTQVYIIVSTSFRSVPSSFTGVLSFNVFITSVLFLLIMKPSLLTYLLTASVSSWISVTGLSEIICIVQIIKTIVVIPDNARFSSHGLLSWQSQRQCKKGLMKGRHLGEQQYLLASKHVCFFLLICKNNIGWVFI